MNKPRPKYKQLYEEMLEKYRSEKDNVETGRKGLWSLAKLLDEIHDGSYKKNRYACSPRIFYDCWHIGELVDSHENLIRGCLCYLTSHVRRKILKFELKKIERSEDEVI